jgi:hypothetical protein
MEVERRRGWRRCMEWRSGEDGVGMEGSEGGGEGNGVRRDIVPEKK